MIDLRSDTVTTPTDGMRHAMMDAEVGDDVFCEDPTVNELEDKVSELFGIEAGLFVPSGTMGNQISIKILTEPGDEILIEKKGHIFNYEGGAASFISSVQLQTLAGHRGKLTAEMLHDRIRGKFMWEPNTRVIAVENSTNKGGGACYTKSELEELRAFADDHGLKIHLDGARLWNAIAATNIDPAFFGKVADTISVCFSKGLGAPVGSMVLSSGENIRRARRFRKMLGGGMRQVGMLAAAANYAIDHHWSKLEDDHRRAKELAELINACSKLQIDTESVETNIVIFVLMEEKAESALKKLEERGVRMVPFGPQTIRATFHYQVTDEDLEHVIRVMKGLFN
ncbi:aminotransferase class I/II-fold pyridoxal phosphate-dependent enzyme [Aliifodinibius sp. S!AR15-10]|uniref:threonine aldolase family protein n=1 Tax=Aliifodinibius sp. S!AR15-10 TaxID=2950437 RepID=UPI002862BF25|nr:GntG family PLP-dependent aldolase [Aliifodinibius sp. S!AR15-10]MDR8390424.1 aminotransferase class I/II-fold pyridoxal phosphate-dependent enzyme [Aliifodinibius sp. S!AR15-10]